MRLTRIESEVKAGRPEDFTPLPAADACDASEKEIQ